MKMFQKAGGAAALVCALTYLVSMGLFVTQLAPFDNPDLSFAQFMSFFLANQGLIFFWHLFMYFVGGVFLVILALALYHRLKAGAPALAQVATVLGLIWAVFIFASGLITIYGWETIASLYPQDPAQAAALRVTVETIATGIDHSDRLLGGLWVLLIGWAALRTHGLPRPLYILGLLIGIPAVISTILPAATDLGLAFGLGVIFWYLGLGWVLLRDRRDWDQAVLAMPDRAGAEPAKAPGALRPAG